MKHEITPAEYIRATIAILKEKGKASIGFDPKCYDPCLTKDELPWCIYFDEIISYITAPSLCSEESLADLSDKEKAWLAAHPECLIISVENDGGQIFYDFFAADTHFLHEEGENYAGEDFERIFYDVYDELWDGGINDEEGYFFLNRFLDLDRTVKEQLVALIENNAPEGVLTVRNPYFDAGSGLDFDTLQRMPDEGNRLFLVDYANGPNNPQGIILDSLTPSFLLNILRDITDKQADNLDKESFVALYKAAYRNTRKEIVSSFIYERLASLKEGDAVSVPSDEGDWRCPYLITLDGFLGNTIEDTRDFNGIVIEKKSPGRIAVIPTWLGEPLVPDERLIVTPDAVYAEDHRTMNNTCVTYLPDEALWFLEEAVNGQIR